MGYGILGFTQVRYFPAFTFVGGPGRGDLELESFTALARREGELPSEGSIRVQQILSTQGDVNIDIEYIVGLFVVLVMRVLESCV